MAFPAFDETKHPRGNPENRGRFADKGGAGEPDPAALRLQAIGGVRDNSRDMGREVGSRLAKARQVADARLRLSQAGASDSAELIGVEGVNLERELRPPDGTGLDALPSLRRTARLLADARYHGVMHGRTPGREALVAKAESAFGESLKAVASGLPESGERPGDVSALRGALVIDPAELGRERDGAMALAAKASPVAGPGFDGLAVVVPEGPAKKAFAAITNAGDQAAFGERLKDTSDAEGLLGKLYERSRAPEITKGRSRYRFVTQGAVVRKNAGGEYSLLSAGKYFAKHGAE